MWGAALTKEGVDELLQVGWRYHEQRLEVVPISDGDGGHGSGASPVPIDTGRQQQEEELEQPQLFLQIYDKGRGPGYNDENSILRGGIEQIAEYDYFRRVSQDPPVSTTAPTTTTPTQPPDDAVHGGDNGIPSPPPSTSSR